MVSEAIEGEVQPPRPRGGPAAERAGLALSPWQEPLGLGCGQASALPPSASFCMEL